ncbi:sushi, von Willebrand factor type A, EGF and pentraxin domain-containing protein 1-like [Mercenaria mercenaria]|uniref:sushi, von Willebrand factor type A, EGF and pentraxin domain-containing protein 1-like n=1 Tax=Mercenaria mercenaria TaxID=6596 RepID=UPI00234E7A1D|nr:sushi, von Willebrand factor type A, EGF and pentraxin domain-containing protein 1-like [Mercenaria mercenaria]
MSGDGAVFNDYVQPACLPGENDPLNYGMQCEVSGWGILREGGHVMSDYLMFGKVPIVNERKCEEMYNDIKSEMDLQRMFCAGDGKIGTDTCQGDSGGPLVCDMNDRNTVIGITSWGRGCGRPDAPGVYTNVAAYVSWIKEQISLYDSAEGCILPKNSAKFRYPRTAYNVGETLTEFDCDPGFIVSSPSIMTCQKGGSWSDNVVCQRGCSLPNHAANHKRWGTTFGPGETVNNFFCDHGYVLSSEKGMTCRHDGSWSHTVTCIKGCTLPNHAANSKDLRTTFSPGETLNNFHCNQGYVLSSQNGMTCRHDGSWSEIVTCVKVCKLPNNAANYKRWRTTFTPGETLNDFYCNQGYVLSSLHGMTCRHDGSWSKIVTCIKECDSKASSKKRTH